MNQLGPFPLEISRDRVTDENAEVRILAPNHPLMNTPNKITRRTSKAGCRSADFTFPNNGIPRGRQFCRATIRAKSHSTADCSLRSQATVTSSTPVIPGSDSCRPVFLERIGSSRTWCHWENERTAIDNPDASFLAQGLWLRHCHLRRGGRAALPVYGPVFVNRLDYIVLIATILAIPLYGLWRTRGSASVGQYLKGDASIRWGTIGLSVLATQAGPITFLSMPGQAYESGIGFIQNYFGQPFALIVVCAIFVPIYQRLKVYTAYEYLGQRFDRKTRLLGAFLFLVQRGIAAGITIYAPAIILSALLGWHLNLTIWLAGGLVIIYTVVGGTKIVSITQRYQMMVIFVGMAMAFGIAVYRLPPDLSFDTLSIAGKMGKLQAVDFSLDPHKRYTFWSGILGGFFLALSYFGADQSQVQRYLAGGSLRASRIGLLFNAIVKVPMQFLILLLGAMVFMFYQFEKPPVYFNQPAYQRAMERGYAPQLTELQTEFDDVFTQKRDAIRALSIASSNERDAAMNKVRALEAQARDFAIERAGSRAGGRRPKEQGIRLRFHYFCPSTSAAWNRRSARRRDLVRDDVGDVSDSECAWFNNGDRSLSAVDPPERERPSLCRRHARADSRMGSDRHRRRFVCQSGREPNRSRQYPGVDILRQHSWSFPGRLLHSSSYRLRGFFRGAHRANTRARPLRDHEHRLPLV